MQFSKVKRRKRIQQRIRKKIKGTADKPRLSIFRSNTSIYCQLINDVDGVTLLAASSRENAVDKSASKTDQSKAVGKILAERALAKDISQVVFDRGGNLYHGRVKALAEGAREAGLKF